MEKYKNKTIVFFGDSITDTVKYGNSNYPYGAGYVNMIKTELDVCYPELNIKIFNEGISGNKTENLLERFEQSVTQHKPNLVFMFIGINDVWHPVEQQGIAPNNKEILERITLLINKIKDLGSKVVLMVPFLFPREPFYEFFTSLKPYFISFYEEYIKYLEANNLEYIDINAIMSPYSELSKERLTKDSVHPDVIGHGIIAQAVIDYLKK